MWLLNPILTALTALNVYRLTQRVYGEPQARAAVAVFAVSPMVLIMGATHMNHMPTAWLVTLALATLAAWIAAPDARARNRAAAIIGVALGVAIAVRPLDGVVATVIVGLAMLAAAARERGRTRSILIAIAGGADQLEVPHRIHVDLRNLHVGERGADVAAIGLPVVLLIERHPLSGGGTQHD